MRYLPYKQLYYFYVDKLWTEKAIAQHFNCSLYTVRENIALHGFPKGRLERKWKLTSQELKKRLIHLHQECGLNVREIAKRFKANKGQIRRYLHKFEIYQKQMQKRRRKQLPTKELRELYQERYWPVQEIAKHFRCSAGHVYRELQKQQIYRERRYGLRKKLRMTDRQLVATLHQMYWEQEMTMQQIAEQWGVTLHCIWKHFRRLGIETRFNERRAKG